MLMPALLTSTSTPPMRRTASAYADCTCFKFETSASSTPLRPGSSCKMLLRASASRSSIETTEPSSRKRAAAAAPIPLAPPPDQKKRADQDTCLPMIWPDSRAPRISGLRADLKQQMLLELRRKFSDAVSRRFNRSKILSLGVIADAIFPRLQPAQFDLTLPCRVRRREERVIHLAVLRDRVRFRDVVASHIKVEELALRKHLLVIETDPLLPVLLFCSRQIHGLELRSGIGPDKLRPHHSSGSNRGREIVAMLFPVAGVAHSGHRGKLNVIAIDR